ncbi:hypothetical protein ACJMK2_017162 [Sinanodonta woodiana]|uniref:Sushi domain-containing protein n=1 Tax=Sinanodonta woodiana TaxID=1069815 RepID=A0ABD3UXC1_SINWO
MAGCADPASITGGTIVTTGPYNDGSLAVFSCTSGYSMSGKPYTTCVNGAWDYTPHCVKTTDINVKNTTTVDSCQIPDWFYYIVAAAILVVGLFFLIATLFCLLQLCRCKRRYYILGSDDRCCCGGGMRGYTPFSVDRGFYNGDAQSSSKITELTNVPDSSSSQRTRFVNVVENAARPPAKVVPAWMPHTNPIRNINTSTK